MTFSRRDVLQGIASFATVVAARNSSVYTAKSKTSDSADSPHWPRQLGSPVTESLRQLKVTTILVAHRLSTIRHAARIYVIEAGRVVQSGSFDELAHEDGLFARLMARQRI